MGHRFTGRMWTPVLDALAERHRVLWFDNRGTGLSGSTRDATIADLAGDALAVLDAAGVEAAHVFGVSQGGVVVLDLALTAPERVLSLVVGCSGALTPDKPRAPKSRYVLYYLPTWLTLKFAPKALYGPACPPERLAADLDLLRGEVIDPRGVIAQAKALAAYSVTLEQVATITTPTLVLHGTADKVVPFEAAEELDATLPDSTLVAYEGSGHNFVAEVPDRVAADVVRFTSDVEARRASR
ncbi:MAG: Lipase/esterase [Frankiales bacterium]|nr:Lipase/esterase [Frankiales bacterium]